MLNKFYLRISREFMTIHATDLDCEIRYIWMVLTRQEALSFRHDSIQTFCDGAHRLSMCGDQCTFFDFNLPENTDGPGIFTIPYYTVTIPYMVRKLWVRLAESHWKTGSEENKEIHFDAKTINRWLSKYGQGFGKVAKKGPDIFLVHNSEKEMASMKKAMNHLERIARNSTRATFETAEVWYWPDGKGFFWRVFNSVGKEIMHGGLFPFEGEWSLHT